jgi:1,4-alpha-glucan branching enzyme
MCDPQSMDNEEWTPSSWGKDGDLSTWSSPPVADMAFTTRAAELQTLAARGRAGAVALRELLALQSSDWVFMVSRELAVPYAQERFEGHRKAFERALADGGDAGVEELRNVAVHADPAVLLGP